MSAGALTEDVPLTFQSAVLSSFLPTTADATALLEFSIDFAGRALKDGADLSVLASQFPSLGLDETLVVAHVESLDGRSRLVPVAIGELAGDRYMARAVHGLSGIRLGGRYVWYRVTGGIGFVRGLTDAAGTPVSTVVEVSGVPFATPGVDGRYATVGRAGSVTVRARAAGTSLAGDEDATTVAGAEVTVNISLVGEVTAATVTPATGAIAVSPGAQVEVSSSVPIKPGSLTTVYYLNGN
ncbi:MAG: hypothetical protein Q7R30_20470 [Acidobacteriota bacterium]|nr:hypothetical protein [Acidobacteriota bacterium]